MRRLVFGGVGAGSGVRSRSKSCARIAGGRRRHRGGGVNVRRSSGERLRFRLRGIGAGLLCERGAIMPGNVVAMLALHVNKLASTIEAEDNGA
jgi:hypothetical protein